MPPVQTCCLLAENMNEISASKCFICKLTMFRVPRHSEVIYKKKTIEIDSSGLSEPCKHCASKMHITTKK